MNEAEFLRRITEIEEVVCIFIFCYLINNKKLKKYTLHLDLCEFKKKLQDI